MSNSTEEQGSPVTLAVLVLLHALLPDRQMSSEGCSGGDLGKGKFPLVRSKSIMDSAFPAFCYRISSVTLYPESEC